MTAEERQELANTAWAYAAADVPSDALFKGSRFVELCDAAAESFKTSELCQLHQWLLWLDERTLAWPQLSPALAARCRESFGAEEGVPSRLQMRVTAALREGMGLPLREEVRTPLEYSVDAVVDFEGREVAVEVDGPSHFVGRAPNGATALKRRQLRAAGWLLLPVPYWEWDDLEADAERGVGEANARHAYLQRGLRAAVASLVR